ncbi:MAG TPA: peptidoglycan DD-metalloendopeptidase family protein [Candidatus Paceibacterota bacterium]
MSERARHISATVVLLLCAPSFAQAQSAAELQQQIDQHSAQITQLDKEIAEYQKQLQATSAKKQTLQTQLAQLALSIKKTTASIDRTKNQIGSTELQIQQLSSGISKTEGAIAGQERGLAESLRALNEAETQPLVIKMASEGALTEVWNDLAAAESLQIALGEHIESLRSAKQVLTDTKAATEEKRAQLVKQRNTLLTQQGSLNATKQAQSELLAQTKSKESNYQAIIAQKKAQEAQFEQALNDLQEKLRYTVNPSQITPAGKGVLSWPLDGVRMTQYFGNTPFASGGAYGGKGHNGIDLAAQIGTPIKAALSGTVIGAGNTDAVRGCYSFGKWVFIKHGNGLGSIYAHLSQIAVMEGQQVSTGQLLGYSGETGYATGPHLHFGVYVASAVQIIPLSSATQTKTPCASAVMPVAPLTGYLNPLNYLPTI